MTQCAPEASLCLHFCRGCCSKGMRCQYKHQVPTEEDELRLSMLKDIFGRTRHGSDRDDMGGVGNFNRNNRTLYVGGVISKEESQKETEKMVKKDFSEFGELEYVRVIPSKCIAFVRYKLRAAAEFAHIAMSDQKTPYGELNVRWAHVDPNPLAKEFDRRADEALAQYAIAKRIMEMSASQQQEWAQMQMVQNGVYPDQQQAAAASVAAVQRAPQQQQQLPPQGAGGFANRFAQYWSNFYAKKMADRFGLKLPETATISAPPPPPQVLEEARQQGDVPEAPAVLVNPHTGEAVADTYAVNPYSQAPHPYSYRDYGWNRNKDKDGKEKRKFKKREKGDEGAPQHHGKYDAQQDPNYHYGPQGAAMEKKRARHGESNRGGAPAGEAQVVRPGVPAPQAASQPQMVVPRGRGRVAAASQEEVEALQNDEPLVFGK